MNGKETFCPFVRMFSHLVVAVKFMYLTWFDVILVGRIICIFIYSNDQWQWPFRESTFCLFLIFSSIYLCLYIDSKTAIYIKAET